MLKRLRDELYGSVEVHFDVPGAPEAAASALAQATPRSAMSTLTAESVVGAVSPDRVVLHRHRPFFSNSFAPVFRGEFRVKSGRTQLCGAFRLHVFVQVFMTVCFGFLLLFLPFAVLRGALGAAESGAHWAAGLFAGLVMAGPAFLMGLAAFAFVRLGKWLAREDRPKIEAHIRRTFESSAV
ncbi:MAG: hypothetical protein CMJ98_13800 [Planctomycetes bacterium]|nr:hypothetical protein [Planctomycetota bacterium]